MAAGSAPFEDTLGNTYTFLINSNGWLQYIKYWNHLDTTEPTTTITLSYYNQVLAFGAGATTDPTLPSQAMLTQVLFPSGLRYAFSYQESGEMTQITYPTCATSRYGYAARSVYDRLLGAAVTEHWVSTHDMGDANTWGWAYNGSGQAAPTATTISLPGGATVTHYMQKSSPGWADGLITSIVGSGDPGTESSQDWTQDDVQSSIIYNPRVTFKERKLKGGTPQTIRTEFTYAAATDYSGNVTETREYSFAGALRRKTTFSYLHQSVGAYAALNITDRITTTLVYDGQNTIVAKSVTEYDGFALTAAPNAIRHDPGYGTSFLLRGLPTAVKKWYNIASDQWIRSTVQYDECGNGIVMTDFNSNISTAQYWLSAADNAYAFPLRVFNARSQQQVAAYSYKSGLILSQTDANGVQTTYTYDNRDRLVRLNKPSGGAVTYTYSDACDCGANPVVTPYAEVRTYITGSPDDPPNAKYQTSRSKIDTMGRLVEKEAVDPVGGNIKTENTFGSWGQLSSVSVPHRTGATSYPVAYGYSGASHLASITLPEGGTISYLYQDKNVTVTQTDGRKRRYAYNEDGKIAQVIEEDDNGALTLTTNYIYDTLARLTGVLQGVQTRSFSYDALGRLVSETHPETGTMTYSYDNNSNLLTKVDGRGIQTAFIYDNLNRVTRKSYSDATPMIDFFYDEAPQGSPITIQRPIGRLTRVTTTTSGVTVTNYYSYCTCSSVEQEATVITDGTTKTYITQYTRDYLGNIVSMVYPGGKVVSYTADSQGRPSKVSTTAGGQSVDLVRSTQYLGPAGQVSQVEYGIRNDPYTDLLPEKRISIFPENLAPDVPEHHRIQRDPQLSFTRK